ncbi:hypothetical protein GCM10009422_20610 [Brevundimonas kwangchunensis]|uniref:Uncharacterized protein n=1 Tax=Brevundimonas kwangchunensis TaxID=322163 RepID=A0ABN1H037_9CAUL
MSEKFVGHFGTLHPGQPFFKPVKDPSPVGDSSTEPCWCVKNGRTIQNNDGGLARRAGKAKIATETVTFLNQIHGAA